MRTMILLAISNLFMNLAWYGHLKFCNHALWIAIPVLLLYLGEGAKKQLKSPGAPSVTQHPQTTEFPVK